MLEASKKNLSLFVQRTPFVSDVVVSVSFKTNCSGCCLNKLKSNYQCECFPKGSEESCLAYSMYLLVNNALTGDPLAVSKSKSSCVQCGCNNGTFFITWKVKGTGSAVRKSLGMALKQMNPAKLYSMYANCVKHCGGKPDRESFNYVVDKFVKSMKDSVHCGVIGNIKTEKKDGNKTVPALDLPAMLEVLAKKVNLSDADTPKSESKNHKDCDHSTSTELKVSGWEATVVKDYIDSKARAQIARVCDKYVLVNMHPNKWDTMATKLKDRLKDHIKQKFAKLDTDNNLAPLLGYMMLSDATGSCMDAKQMIKKNVKSSDVEKAIKSVL